MAVDLFMYTWILAKHSLVTTAARESIHADTDLGQALASTERKRDTVATDITPTTTLSGSIVSNVTRAVNTDESCFIKRIQKVRLGLVLALAHYDHEY